MDEKRVCPICKGERFLHYSTKNENGLVYEMYKRCSCMTNKPNTDNPFKEGEKKRGVDSSALSGNTPD